MEPAQPPPRPRRPRPGPGAQPVRRPRPGPGVPPAGRGPVRLTRRARLAGLARAARVRRGAAVAAIAAGIALFVVTALTGPVSGQPAAKPLGRPATSSVEVPAFLMPVSTPPASPAVKKVLKPDPTHVHHKAPVNHGVISGLAANGIPSVALNAYRVAAARMDNVDPACGIDWSLLAGIGREESDHGRFAGAVLHADGVSTPAIVGPALDGVHWDYVPAPANGLALDGDAKYAHALGPMQFIPSTWAIYGTDANGDGRADIFNINDAALGAARYLCSAGGDLRTQGGRVRAVLAYNHSDQYLAQVLALADAYHRGIPITGIPVGITSGPLPKVTDTGYIPPANPGAPTAVDKTKHKHAKHKAKKTGSTPSGSATRSPSSSTSGTKPPAPKSSSSKPAPSGSSTTKPAPSSTTPAPSPTTSKPCLKWEQLLHLCKPTPSG